jgi:hypothetical protein
MINTNAHNFNTGIENFNIKMHNSNTGCLCELSNTGFVLQSLNFSKSIVIIIDRKSNKYSTRLHFLMV